jgi:hypothetical protein
LKKLLEALSDFLEGLLPQPEPERIPVRVKTPPRR